MRVDAREREKEDCESIIAQHYALRNGGHAH